MVDDVVGQCRVAEFPVGRDLSAEGVVECLESDLTCGLVWLSVQLTPDGGK